MSALFFMSLLNSVIVSKNTDQGKLPFALRSLQSTSLVRVARLTLGGTAEEAMMVILLEDGFL